MNNIGVILVNWNGGQLTKDCIDSLYTGSIVPDFIVVVDNDSKDDSIELLTNSFSEKIHIIQNEENKGFAEANNQGIAYLTGIGAEYIWILNNDTVVDKNCLEELLKVLNVSNDNHLAAVSSKIYYESERDKIWFAGATRNPYSFAVKHCTQEIQDNIKTPFISGCCIFAKAEIFKKYGGLQTQFIAYSEDVDWCLRLESDGYFFMCANKSVLYHKVSASLKKNTGVYNRISDRALFLMNRNHIWIIRKYAPHKILNLFVMIGICFRNSISSLIEMRRIGIYIKSLYHGIFDDISCQKNIVYYD